MKLDRNSIERRDFAANRKGYDQAEVDAHLSAVANAVEELRRNTAAGTAASRVQSVIEAAERSAAEIEAAAREQAAERSRKSEQAASLINEASAELARLKRALDDLVGPEEGAGAVPSAGQALPSGREAAVARAEDEAGPPEAEAGPPEADAGPPDAHAEVVAEVEEVAAEAEAAQGAEVHESAGGGAQGDGVEGARLIALNMALNGVSREETARYLAENFELDDADVLLDEVYAG